MSKANIDIVILDEIDSTNNEAQRALNYKSNFPFWIIANEQTSGRGRKNSCLLYTSDAADED